MTQGNEGMPGRMRYSLESRVRAVRMVEEEGLRPSEVVRRQGMGRATLDRWLRRYRAEGVDGLRDRSSRPQHQPRRLTPEEEAEILEVRAKTGAGPQRIGAALGRPASTVGKVLRRRGVSRLPKPPRPPVQRYERAAPGELLHVDIKRLACFWQPGKRILGEGPTRNVGAGWEFAHVAVDDHSRLAYVELLPTERSADAAAFLRRAAAWFAERGVVAQAVLTDNGGCYLAQPWRAACAALALRHLRTRPYRPQTNGKAERFIQTLLRSWAYAWPYRSSRQRARALGSWLRWYNHRRPHAALAGYPPCARVPLLCGYDN